MNSFSTSSMHNNNLCAVIVSLSMPNLCFVTFIMPNTLSTVFSISPCSAKSSLSLPSIIIFIFLAPLVYIKFLSLLLLYCFRFDFKKRRFKQLKNITDQIIPPPPIKLHLAKIYANKKAAQ